MVLLTLHRLCSTSISVTIEGMKFDVGKMGEELSKGQARIEDRLNAFFVMFQDQMRDLNSIGTKKLGNEDNVGILTTRKLLKSLGCKPKLTKSDISKAISHGQAASRTFQQKAQSLMQNSRLKSWLTSPESSTLLVNGNGTREKISSLSLTCGMLAKSLESFEGSISLSYFCGMHSGVEESEGVQNMLAELTHQLLSSFPHFDLNFVKIRHTPSDIKSHNLDVLCHIFSGLVHQLPEDQITFCVIDGITFYEYGKHNPDFREVVSMLVDLAENCSTVFKLLITSSTKSISIDNLIDKKDILNLKDGGNYNDRGLSIRKALEGNSRSMENLSTERLAKKKQRDTWTESSSGGDQSDTSSSDSSTDG
ncbi:hypothetical protein HYFRA_00013864 [Hymenoscyphus fraxineus]|uniref:Nephrocystin 3-like N-terminal domain-containing protein n=1 Tax=Hymenoscyphus fraxineus TaxID=746836 RepID=A0A9N9LBL8_9HELO|nr:hypothetical protein HYFRA_00013864 [Hymenoscyphus fraxineus]